MNTENLISFSISRDELAEIRQTITIFEENTRAQYLFWPHSPHISKLERGFYFIILPAWEGKILFIS